MSRLWDVQYNTLKTKRLAVALGLSRSLWGPFKYRERCILVRRRQPLEGQLEGSPVLPDCAGNNFPVRNVSWRPTGTC